MSAVVKTEGRSGGDIERAAVRSAVGQVDGAAGDVDGAGIVEDPVDERGAGSSGFLKEACVIEHRENAAGIHVQIALQIEDRAGCVLQSRGACAAKIRVA